MAEISPDLQWQYGLLIGSIPEEIRKAVDSEELKDRLVRAERLRHDSQAASSPAVSRALGEQAHRVLTARPRAETVRIVKAKLDKARRMADPVQAASLEQQARDELDMHPPAPARRDADGDPVVKASPKTAAADPLFVFHDPDGVPIAACDPKSKDLIWLARPDEVAARVAKAQRAPRAAPAPKARAAAAATRRPGRR